MARTIRAAESEGVGSVPVGGLVFGVPRFRLFLLVEDMCI